RIASSLSCYCNSPLAPIGAPVVWNRKRVIINGDQAHAKVWIIAGAGDSAEVDRLWCQPAVRDRSQRAVDVDPGRAVQRVLLLQVLHALGRGVPVEMKTELPACTGELEEPNRCPGERPCYCSDRESARRSFRRSGRRQSQRCPPR